LQAAAVAAQFTIEQTTLAHYSNILLVKSDFSVMTEINDKGGLDATQTNKSKVE
jgi:hypothetical protein